MTTKFRARFDGKALVPEERLDLPLNRTFEVEIMDAADTSSPDGGGAAAEQECAAFERFVAMAVPGVSFTGEALRREKMYEDRA